MSSKTEIKWYKVLDNPEALLEVMCDVTLI
jgi:hypothetical protein